MEENEVKWNDLLDELKKFTWYRFETIGDKFYLKLAWDIGLVGKRIDSPSEYCENGSTRFVALSATTSD